MPFLRSVHTLLSVDRAETGINAALVSESPPEEPPDALHVTVEVPATRRNLAPDGKQGVLGSRRRELRGGPVRPCSRRIHVPFCVLVRGANHLREVDHDRLAAVAPDEDVELVEVAVDQARTRKAHDEVHQRRVQLPRVGMLRYLAAAPGQIVRGTLATTHSGYASMSSMRMVCRA